MQAVFSDSSGSAHKTSLGKGLGAYPEETIGQYLRHFRLPSLGQLQGE